MTVAVCLVVALRTIDLRCADMTEKEEGLQKNGAMPFVRSLHYCTVGTGTTDRGLQDKSALSQPTRNLSTRQQYLMENDTAHTSEKAISPENTTETVVLSKNAQKRALKMARQQERKMEHRAKEKAAKKEKKRKRAERLAAGEQLSEDERQKRVKMNRAKEPFAARVVLDLGFDDKMSDKVRGHPLCCFTACRNGTGSCSTQEITSLCSQLAYVYSVNRRSSNPFRSLLFTSLNGRMLSRLEKLNDAGYKRWAGTEWWAEGYERLWIQNSAGSALGDGESSGGAATGGGRAEDNEDDNNPEKLLATPVSQDRVVYLTADSTEVLEELKEGETYVIGGLCDHNRYKVRR